MRPATQGRRTEGRAAAYRLNLAVFSAIALFAGMFLIYQSVTLSVVRRRREIGLLRTLGMTPAQVLAVFLAEGLVSGLLGGPPGPDPGGGPGPGSPGGDDPEPHFPLHAGGGRRGLDSGRPVVPGLGPGGASHPGGPALPAREAARTQLRAAWHREELEEKLEGRAGIFFIWGRGGPDLAGVGASWKVGEGPPWPGFVAAFLILLGFALFTPLSARLLGRGLQRPLQKMARRGPGLPVSGRVPEPQAVSIAALACALGMLIAVTVMIGSFRQTVNDWVSRAISGDIFFGLVVFSTAATTSTCRRRSCRSCSGTRRSPTSTSTAACVCPSGTAISW